MLAAPKAASDWPSKLRLSACLATLLLRLKNRAQFQAVLAQRVIAKTEHFALHRHPLVGVSEIALARSPSPPAMLAPVHMSSSYVHPQTKPQFDRPLFPSAELWLGAMVPKRWAKRSVTRHAIKRQIFDVLDSRLAPDEQAAYLVRLRAGFSRQQFLSSTSELLKQAVRIELNSLLDLAKAACPGSRSA